MYVVQVKKENEPSSTIIFSALRQCSARECPVLGSVLIDHDWPNVGEATGLAEVRVHHKLDVPI